MSGSLHLFYQVDSTSQNVQRMKPFIKYCLEDRQLNLAWRVSLKVLQRSTILCSEILSTCTLDARGLLARQRRGASLERVCDSSSRLRRSILSPPTRKKLLAPRVPYLWYSWNFYNCLVRAQWCKRPQKKMLLVYVRSSRRVTVRVLSHWQTYVTYI